MRSAKQWIQWTTPLWMHCKRSSLMAVLGLFISVHLLTAAPPEHNFADTSLMTANWNSAAEANLNVIVESGESSVSVDVVLRDATCPAKPSLKSRFLSADLMSGLRRFTETGSTGPPSQ